MELMSALGSVGWALAIQSPTSMKHHSNHRFLALREGPSEESLHERLKARPEKATPEVHLRIFDLRSMRQLNAANAILIDERADCRGPKRRHYYIASEIDFATARAELMNIWASGLGVRFFTVMTIAQIFISSEWRFGAVRTQRTSPVDEGSAISLLNPVPISYLLAHSAAGRGPWGAVS
ncbi:hypothetical protein [Bradyrhizobium sp. AUGA SZCCT0182]|uniref:hypothetical protein n=1 Tax=Bradyrhizobium sp. AUGA SZCCT0182 TaxID=2807667 RepID=UPI001BA67000|nr:hypothetical protein [Bradyrhizobium sp. AUGA SZCCT0182]MBR1238306.1 hypothetical protein [Bradyrhizobium sp. AUGA SZCCT0182]